MTRTLRLDPVDGWHHVMSRGVDRSPIFFSDADRLDFGALLGDAVRRFGIEVHAYCLMSNHFHLLVRCPDANLSDAMHFLLSVFAMRVNERARRVGHLFGDRFCSRLIVETRYLANVVRYIHLNPVDIVGIDSPSMYRWSSHRTYLGLRPCPKWLSFSTVTSWFEDTNGYERFIEASPRSTHGPLATERPDQVLACVDMLLAERSVVGFRRLPALRRAAALTLSATTPGTASQARMFDELGLLTGGAQRTALSRARKLLRDEPLIAEVVALATQLLDQAGAPIRDAA